MSFFEPQLVGRTFQLVSLLDLLQQGADETRKAIAGMVREQDTSLVVIDGFAGMQQLLGGDESIPHFLYQLGAQLALLGATTLVLMKATRTSLRTAPSCRSPIRSSLSDVTDMLAAIGDCSRS